MRELEEEVVVIPVNPKLFSPVDRSRVGWGLAGNEFSDFGSDPIPNDGLREFEFPKVGVSSRLIPVLLFSPKL